MAALGALQPRLVTLATVAVHVGRAIFPILGHEEAGEAGKEGGEEKAVTVDEDEGGDVEGIDSEGGGVCQAAC